MDFTATHALFPPIPIIGAMYSSASARPMADHARLPGRICDAPLMVSADVRPSTPPFPPVEVVGERFLQLQDQQYIELAD